jgi:hypothetical protein
MVEVYVWDHSKDLAAAYAVGNKKFPLVIFRQKTRMSEADVTVAWIEIYVFIASKCLWYKGLQSRKDFTVQNCFVKKWKNIGILV